MAYIHRDLARRDFLSQAARLSAMAGTPFAMNLLAAGAASAQTATDHRALVCIFQAGGNDQSNTVVPRSGASYLSYQQARPTLALPAANLLPISPTGYSGPALGLHPALSALQQLFNQQRVALVANSLEVLIEDAPGYKLAISENQLNAYFRPAAASEGLLEKAQALLRAQRSAELHDPIDRPRMRS